MNELLGSSRAIASAWTEAAAAIAGIPLPSAPLLAQTPRDELPLEGGARLLHFRNAATIAKPIVGMKPPIQPLPIW